MRHARPRADAKRDQALRVDLQDDDGNLWAWALDRNKAPVRVWLATGKDLNRLKLGDLARCRLGTAQADGTLTATVISTLPASHAQTLVGKVEGTWLRPADKRDRKQYRIVGGLNHEDGHLVVARPGCARRGASQEVEIVEVLGHFGAVAAIAPLSLAEAGIPVAFPAAALDQAQAATPPRLDPFREDRRAVPFVTIDGEDAKDFDDAVYAEPDPKVVGGWRIQVAIADVAAYVEPGSPLDREAQRRGNSVYLPDHVVPMLPEALSNGWCSLVPQEDRASLLVQLQIDARGTLKTFGFVRALVRSKARLTYRQVHAWMKGDQAAIDPALHPHMAHLVAAYEALKSARQRRGALDLHLPERRAQISADGTRVEALVEQTAGPANQLIEEMMILANVAAARVFSARGCTGLYRVHPAPEPARIETLINILQNTPAERSKKTKALDPQDFNRILRAVRGQPYEETMKEQVLRTQSMALYRIVNIGHFGLGLPDYAHFTSPIRRYADLLVHRALITALSLGPAGQDLADLPQVEQTTQHLCETERRAQLAERQAHSRYLAAYHASDLDHVLLGRITGLTKAGVFVRLAASGGDAFVPSSLMGPDRFDFDAAALTLRGRRSRRVLSLGDLCTVKLRQASAHTGSLIGELIEQVQSVKRAPESGMRNRSTRPSKIRAKGAKGQTKLRNRNKTGKKPAKI